MALSAQPAKILFVGVLKAYEDHSIHLLHLASWTEESVMVEFPQETLLWSQSLLAQCWVPQSTEMSLSAPPASPPLVWVLKAHEDHLIHLLHLVSWTEESAMVEFRQQTLVHLEQCRVVQELPQQAPGLRIAMAKRTSVTQVSQ
jgi:hypothetical protein